MELVEIDVLRSKVKRKLVTKSWSFKRLLDIAFYIQIISVFPIASGIFLLTQLKMGDNLLPAIIYFVLALTFAGLLIHSILNSNRLKTIDGISPEQNRQFIKDSISNLNWEIGQDEMNLTVAVLPWNWLSSHWGRHIIIIYDQEKILVNCTTLLLFDIRSPFHWLSNKRLERILTEEFETRAKETTH
jgi:hypothetical protein